MLADLVVLGAGPAGIAISLLMARKGHRIEMIDPAKFPRKKICGEFLNPQAVRWMKKQDLLKGLLELHPYPIYGIKIHDLDGNSFTGRYRPDREVCGYAVMREGFDTLLVRQARGVGIRIYEGVRAERLLFDNNQVVGVRATDSEGRQFDFTGSMLIGADGRNNLIGRTFNWVREIHGFRKYAFQTYYQGLPNLSNYGEVHLVRGGYIGIAPLSEVLANVALVIDEKEYPGGDVDPKTFLQERIRQSPLAERFTGLEPVDTIMCAGPLAFETIKTTGHRTLLVGDTCGFIDPFTGEGINQAFLSADIASVVLDSAFKHQSFDDSFLRTYDVARRKLFSRKKAMNRLFQLAIPNPRVSQKLINRFSRNTDLGDTVVSAVGCALPVEDVWNLRFLLILVFK